MKQIMIVEDDLGLNHGLCKALKSSENVTVACSDLKTAREQMEMGLPDLILLDINLPDGSGLNFLKKCKQTAPWIPVILLTANDTDLDIVEGLDLGADDYVTKPFSLSVLRARVRTQLRNHAEQNGTAEKAIFSQGKYRFDFAHMIFTVGGEIAELSKTEQKLLKVLTDNCGRTVSRDVLINRVWDRASLFSCREGESDKTVRIFLLAERFWKD